MNPPPPDATLRPGLEERAKTRDLDRRLTDGLERSSHALLEAQDPDGSWCYELEADCTIPSEYILMMHFLDEIDGSLQAKLATYVRDRQADHGGWPLYYGGDFDMSASVKAYWALKLAGDDPDGSHMATARRAILERGGAARSNVFTRIALALFGQVPWRAVPFVPVEIVLLPRWFPFNLGKVSYWTRTVMMPLAVLCSLKASARNPTGLGVSELFTIAPEKERDYFPVRSLRNRFYLGLERTARLFEPLIPGFVRRRAFRRAEEWFTERLNGVDGLGAIFPAMVNAYESLVLLGAPEDDPRRRQAKEAIERLVIEHEDWAYCQPCVSPVWDTGLAALALQELQRTMDDTEDAARLGARIEHALDWLVEKQILDGPADWRDDHPALEPGGWAFQYANPHYPDLDDTSVVAWAMWQADPTRYADPIRRATDWLVGMQSQNGGFAAFDADNDHYHLNDIPFADHGALLDPPTADVSARCATLLAMLARDEDKEARREVLDYLLAEQEEDGSWFGRWGTNYVYGTWSVLTAFEQADDRRDPRVEPAVRRAVRWLTSVQREDGGWGETNDSYLDAKLAGKDEVASPYHTAWAVLALIAGGEGGSEAVRRGVEYLLAIQRPDGLWYSDFFNAPGFPRVFYLRYHGYQRYFPVWALARYRRWLAQGS